MKEKNSNSSMGKVDVVLSTLNAEKTIKKCLDAIQKDIPVNKVIIVDGGSNDETIPLIKKHSLWKKTALHIKQELNLGQSRAYAFSQVSTPFFVLIDSDVIIHPGWFNEMAKDIDEKTGAVESGRTTHYAIPSRYGGELDRALFGQNVIRTAAVEGIDIDDLNVLVNENNLPRHYMRKKGYVWKKNGKLLAEHYTNPVRYKDTGLLIYRTNVNKKMWIASGQSDRKTKRYKKIFFMFLDIWYKSVTLWVHLARKCFWYYMGWLRK
jgi:glycosyltransferase involved in cell wall biosynthesis